MHNNNSVLVYVLCLMVSWNLKPVLRIELVHRKDHFHEKYRPQI